MAVLKIKSSPQGRLLDLLEQQSAATRKNAADTIRIAEEHVIKAEEIVFQSAIIVERALRTLDDIGWARRRRSAQGNGNGDSSSQPQSSPEKT